MKICRIKLNNLNSLRGEHEVDLTREPLASAGLFAITGPTGAGKSTLLDAVTLALYGRAARYGNESNPDSMMSRHCGECTAEVEFSVPQGVFRAVWQLRRARGKADGRMQPPQRYVYDSDGQVLAQQIREADGKIDELVGLDYDRFLRSVLLAQGEFARFLKAKSNERAELLESLTGTVIYTELGKLAYSEATRRENELQRKEDAIAQIEVLEDEQREDIEEKAAKGRQEKQKLQDMLEKAAGVRRNVEMLETALRQESEAIEGQKALDEDRANADADLGSLVRHHLTLPFQEDLIRLEGAETTFLRNRK